MQAKNLIDKKSEILEPIHIVAEELAEIDKRNKGHTIEYTELDVVAVAVIMVHVLSNRKAHQYYREAVSNPESTDLDKVMIEMQDYGKRINTLVKEMTGVDLNGQRRSKS